MKPFNALILCLNLALFGLAIYFIFSRGYTPGAGWTPVELVTTVLTALAVLIGVLGIFIAALAVWGYTQLSNQARDVAERAAKMHMGEVAPRLISEELDRRLGSSENYGAAASGNGGENVGQG